MLVLRHVQQTAIVSRFNTIQTMASVTSKIAETTPIPIQMLIQLTVMVAEHRASPHHLLHLARYPQDPMVNATRKHKLSMDVSAQKDVVRIDLVVILLILKVSARQDLFKVVSMLVHRTEIVLLHNFDAAMAFTTSKEIRIISQIPPAPM